MSSVNLFRASDSQVICSSASERRSVHSVDGTHFVRLFSPQTRTDRPTAEHRLMLLIGETVAMTALIGNPRKSNNIQTKRFACDKLLPALALNAV